MPCLCNSGTALHAAAVLTKRWLQEDEQLQVQHGSKEGQVMDELPATPPELAQVQGCAKQQGDIK